jgi:hypothetical protein
MSLQKRAEDIKGLPPSCEQSQLKNNISERNLAELYLYQLTLNIDNELQVAT